MFIPIFIALLMGLISPASQSSNCHNGGTVQVNSGNPLTGDPGSGTPDPGGPGGDAGQNPPPKP